jgi:hypothetical protein
MGALIGVEVVAKLKLAAVPPPSSFTIIGRAPPTAADNTAAAHASDFEAYNLAPGAKRKCARACEWVGGGGGGGGG